jgi:hypothetical protein
MKKTLTLSLVFLSLSACDVPSVPGVTTPGLDLAGSLTSTDSSNTVPIRVGLLGTLSGTTNQKELVSSPVTSNSYRLSVPASPSLDFMNGASQSIAFSLKAYKDFNKDGRYNSSDELLTQTVEAGIFRFYLNDGPAGSYKAGWNIYRNGVYSQSFPTAYNFK